MEMPAQPPDYVVKMAVLAGRSSPCAKSKRGVAAYIAFDWDKNPVSNGQFLVACHNAPPHPLSCGGDGRCKEACGKIAIHAEAAVIQALSERRDSVRWLGSAALVHVKVEDDRLVAGGPPSCVQCSKAILAAGLGGIWLYEHGRVALWRFYTALEFHMETLAHHDLPLHVNAVDVPGAIRQLGGITPERMQRLRPATTVCTCDRVGPDDPGCGVTPCLSVREVDL